VQTARDIVAQAPADEALLHRVQQENQRRILGKLLHDLRNPVHSLRITIELFARLARRAGDMDALMDRAARYAVPAEAALQSLIVVTGRFGLYLSPPVAPVIAPMNVAESLDELALLLDASSRKDNVEVRLHITEDEQPLHVHADRPRLSHALLRYCSSSDGRVRLEATGEGDSVRIDVLSEGPVCEMGAFTAEEFRELMENAGGEVTLAPNRVSLRFKRAAPSPG
jgi:signal transduction histidine kinase